MMLAVNRRRFMTISAAAAGMASFGRFAHASDLSEWRGIALGASASIRLRHPDAERIIAKARAEIDRLESIFSLYRSTSALSRLNVSGQLQKPPFEMLELLGFCGSLHAATGTRFDPTIQPLWQLYAEKLAAGSTPSPEQISEAIERVGWVHVSIASDQISFSKPGMALTLNGIAQGFIADQVADLLKAEGLSNVLVETGEFKAIGGHPEGGAWPVSLRGIDDKMPAQRLELKEMALATSAPMGTVLDRNGTIGHILDPRTGLPAPAQWSRVSVLAPSAALADGLSTAMCLMSPEEIKKVAAAFANVRAIAA